jgi:hypothetical protein
VPFSRELYIERDDFMEDPPKKFFRLAPGREVRLRYAYFITCTEVVKDARGEIVELRCTYDPATRGGDAPDGRKVKATLHWVSAAHALDAEVRLYDRLFRRHALSVRAHRLFLRRSATRPPTAIGVLVFNRTVTLKDSWPMFSGLAAQGKLGPWGFSTQDNTGGYTHMVWYFMSDLAATDQSDAAMMAMDPMKLRGFDVRLRDLSEPEKHRTQLLRIVQSAP